MLFMPAVFWANFPSGLAISTKANECQFKSNGSQRVSTNSQTREMDQAWLRVALSPSVRFSHMACQPCQNLGIECAGTKSHQSSFEYLCLSIYSRYKNRQPSDTGTGRHSMRGEDAVANPTACRRAFG